MTSNDYHKQRTAVESTEPEHQMPLTAESLSCIRSGLLLLNQALWYSTDVRASAWDFAVRIGELTNIGLTMNDLRWLVARGYVEHRQEVLEPRNGHREFSETAKFQIDQRTAFTITDRGRGFLSAKYGAADVPPGIDVDSRRSNGDVLVAQANGSMRAKPRWSSLERELRFGAALVKRFRVRAENQELVLVAFEEEGWPHRIDDPLPPVPDIPPKRRLRMTIHSLNRNQQQQLIAFSGDGTGTRIGWSEIPSDGVRAGLEIRC